MRVLAGVAHRPFSLGAEADNHPRASGCRIMLPAYQTSRKAAVRQSAELPSDRPPPQVALARVARFGDGDFVRRLPGDLIRWSRSCGLPLATC